MSTDARTALEELPNEQANVKADIQLRKRLHVHYDGQLQMLGRPRTPHAMLERDKLLRAKRQLDEGILRSEGVDFPELTPLEGKPGLKKLQRQLDLLDARVEEARETLARWPSPDTRHPFRYIGPADRATFGDRDLMPGDLVTLNEHQAHAWRDRFEAVETPIEMPVES